MAYRFSQFFVLRSYRRSGVGRQAAFALWDGLPGQWVVGVSEANRAGLPFWGEAIRAYTGGAFIESTRLVADRESTQGRSC